MARKKGKKKQQSEIQYRFTQILAVIMFCLIGGYFIQSFLTVREQRPVIVAIERVSAARSASRTEPEIPPE